MENEGYRYFTLKFTILPPPDTRVTPEYRFDPNGAIEYTENEYYKYKYDGKNHYPIISVFYEGIEIEKARSSRGHIINCQNSENNFCDFPVDVDIYKLSYQVWYEKEEDKERFKTVYVNITVEIVEMI